VADITEAPVGKWRRRLAGRLFNALFQNVARKRLPDFIIGGHADPYLLRYYLLGAKPRAAGDNYPKSRSLLGLAYPYLHCFRRSDDDRALHDHPAPSLSLILCGSYVEHTIDAGGVHRRQRLRAGAIRLRSAAAAHRVEVDEGDCWTLFIFGPRIREWGFHCAERGWVQWKAFTKPGDGGQIGKGCDQ
jgi:hypothetical protein